MSQSLVVLLAHNRALYLPMQTRGRDLGYSLHADIDLAPDGSRLLRLGNEYHSFHLDDDWPAGPGSMMMGPRTYVNINDGKRDRYALFAEWEGKLSERWRTIVGMRDELARTDAGNVQSCGTNMMNMADLTTANAFNARGHAKTDNNIDLKPEVAHTLSATADWHASLAASARPPAHCCNLPTTMRACLASMRRGSGHCGRSLDVGVNVRF